MPRTKRVAPGGMVFHALNRGVGRRKIFATDRDYLACEETLEETLRLYPMRILGYCLLPNHWHFSAVAGRGRPAFCVPRAIDEHAHAALAAGETEGRLRASLPRAFQVLSRRDRRAFLY